ncbi:hypothetical protein [Nonomuraea typhae]|uniref:Uncharacterized protein n=1 Tax=Nonomuraea typhae TaxID=2603600 RepID=A0ABW7Z2S4_9ACTN
MVQRRGVRRLAVTAQRQAKADHDLATWLPSDEIRRYTAEGVAARKRFLLKIDPLGCVHRL